MRLFGAAGVTIGRARTRRYEVAGYTVGWARMTSPALPQRILIVRLGAIGDVTNALVVAAAIKRHQPSVRIGWAVHPLAHPLVHGNPLVDRAHLWQRGSGLAGWRALIRELRGERYQLALDLQRLAKSAGIARLSGAERVIGFDKRRTKEASWIFTRERIAAGDPEAHMVEQYLEFVRHLGVEAPAPEHVLPVDPRAERWADEWVERNGGAPLLVNLGATKPANRWSPERFGDLARAAQSEFAHPVVLTGGPDDKQRAERARARSSDKQATLDLVGRTSLLELIALMRRAVCVVACDTGPMHLAAACKTPTVALFGAANPRRTGPWGQMDKVVRVPPPCAPCNLKHCNQPRHACMDDLQVELVLEALRDTLAAQARGRGPAGSDSGPERAARGRR